MGFFETLGSLIRRLFEFISQNWFSILTILIIFFTITIIFGCILFFKTILRVRDITSAQAAEENSVYRVNSQIGIIHSSKMDSHSTTPVGEENPDENRFD